MKLDSYAKAAAPIFQKRGAMQAEISRRARAAGDTDYASFMQRAADSDYRAARQIMEIEAPAE